MSKYERLIIYPLLFMALFYSFTGINIIEAGEEIIDRIVTREIVVVDSEGNEVVTLKSEETSGGVLTIYNELGTPVASMRSREDGGEVIVLNNEEKVVASMSSYGGKCKNIRR